MTEENCADTISLNIWSTIENTLSNGSSSDGTSTVHSSKKTPIDTKKGRIFVPGNELKKKIERKGYLNTICTQINRAIKDIKESLSNDGTKELTQFLEEKSEIQSERDQKLFQLMGMMVNPQAK